MDISSSWYAHSYRIFKGTYFIFIYVTFPFCDAIYFLFFHFFFQYSTPFFLCHFLPFLILKLGFFFSIAIAFLFTDIIFQMSSCLTNYLITFFFPAFTSLASTFSTSLIFAVSEVKTKKRKAIFLSLFPKLHFDANDALSWRQQQLNISVNSLQPSLPNSRSLKPSKERLIATNKGYINTSCY